MSRTNEELLREDEMSWFENKSKVTWLESLCINILKCGPIPRHIAFIMDGNRRFASKMLKESLYGHIEGFKKLSDTLNWCHSIGIHEVTLYAFSIENFKRSEEEVKGLMDLARKKFQVFMTEEKKVMEYGVCVRFIGNLSLLPDDIQRLIAQVTQLTKNNNKSFLNLCFPYTSRDEISNAVKELALGVQDGLIQPSDVTETLLEKCLYTSKSEAPDILIRTSGEVRLSDFLLWQSAYTMLLFVKVLWPEYSIWQLFYAILKYQRHHSVLQSFKDKAAQYRNDTQQKMLEKAMAALSVNCVATSGPARLEESAWILDQEREERTAKFLEQLESKREKFIEDLCKT